MILSIGYRVKSKTAIGFRRWVSNVLKNYMMKGYLLNNDRISISVDNFVRLQNDVNNIKEEIKEIKQEVFIEPKNERIINEGQTFDAHKYLADLFLKVKESVVIIDPYFDISGLDYLKTLSKDVNKYVVLSKKSTLTDKDIESFQNQYGSLNIIRCNDFHDRYLVIDKSIYYSLGASFNRVGQKIYTMHQIIDKEGKDFLDNKIKTMLAQ